MKNVGIKDDHNQGGVYLVQTHNALHFHPYVISLPFCKIFNFPWAVYSHAECNPILILETTRVDLLIKQEPFLYLCRFSVPQKRTWLQSSVEITCFSPIPAFEEDKSFFSMERREKHGPKTRVGWRINVLFCKRKHWLLLWREEGYWYIEKSFIKIEAECVWIFFRKFGACYKLPERQWQIFDFF